MAKGHVLLGSTSKFGVSERMQGLACLVGQSVVYEEASDLLSELAGIAMSGMQIQRICHHYGKTLDVLVEKDCGAVIPRLDTGKDEEGTYVMVDGSMLYTRTDEWKEFKLGRIFRQSQVVDIHTKRREVLHSVYVGHLGGVNDFFPKLERHLVGYGKKVIIGDGAKWIWNWAEDNYPDALQILDFYHAKEKLVLFAKHQFKEKEERRGWVKEQADRLLADGLEKVLEIIRKCRARNPEARATKQNVIHYFTEHDDRMMYGTYKAKGLMIGSGPIEAAHRSVIQQRMKLSGQKWSIDGANANLYLLGFSIHLAILDFQTLDHVLA